MTGLAHFRCWLTFEPPVLVVDPEVNLPSVQFVFLPIDGWDRLQWNK